MSDDLEIWIAIDGTCGNYEVSNHGRVRCWTGKTGLRIAEPRVRLATKNHHGYYQMSMVIDGNAVTRTMQRIVLEAFRGKRPAGLVGAHADGDRSNNRISNLAWITQHKNILHKQIHGTQTKGETHSQCKLNDDKVRRIRLLRERGWTLQRLSDEFGVTVPNIGYICRRQTWTHL